MDGEVAQLAALAISANHRLCHPDDPMEWFAGQRAFASCGRIAFRAAVAGRGGRKRLTPIAETPGDWLALLARSGVRRVVISCTRQDDPGAPMADILPDRLAAGFAGGGSLWQMATLDPQGGALCWRAGWRAAFPEARDGRIWQADYFAEPCVGPDPDADIAGRARALEQALNDARAFAEKHQFHRIATRFASALELLRHGTDPLNLPRPRGAADVLEAPARRLLHAAQRAWLFDDPGGWKDQDFSQDTWAEYARLSEALYCAVTAAVVAAVNSSVCH